MGTLVCANAADLVDGELLRGVADVDEPAGVASSEVMGYRRRDGRGNGDFGGATRGSG